MRKQIIALDGDGVLLDYNLAYPRVWEKAFGVYPHEREPQAYWPLDRWNVERLADDRLRQFRANFDEEFWESVPAMPGALQACQALHAAGFELICVTALQEKFAPARRRNLLRLGFPIDTVVATGKTAIGQSPKAAALHQLNPVAFVDDYLPYLSGLHPSIHTALILRDGTGSPNTGAALQHVSSTHRNLLDFSDWWLKPLSLTTGRSSRQYHP